jgi:hypothetical protein
MAGRRAAGGGCYMLRWWTWVLAGGREEHEDDEDCLARRPAAGAIPDLKNGGRVGQERQGKVGNRANGRRRKCRMNDNFKV